MDIQRVSGSGTVRSDLGYGRWRCALSHTGVGPTEHSFWPRLLKARLPNPHIPPPSVLPWGLCSGTLQEDEVLLRHALASRNEALGGAARQREASATGNRACCNRFLFLKKYSDSRHKALKAHKALHTRA